MPWESEVLGLSTLAERPAQARVEVGVVGERGGGGDPVQPREVSEAKNF